MGSALGARRPCRGTAGYRAPDFPTGLLALCSPANLVLAVLVAAGWLALIGWTGTGSAGWQARLCADLELQPRSCSAVRTTHDAGRVGPFAESGRLSS